ncbi:putative ATP-dependent RNA helicase spindle-E [Blattella germanica]|nr:putative ATP-dependent RNA helicase spindle-E [Blattella germanica]
MADDLLDFFNLKKDFKKVIVPGSQTQGRIVPVDKDIFYDPYDIKKETKGKEYAKQYQEQEEKSLTEDAQNHVLSEGAACLPGGQSKMSDVDALTSIGTLPNMTDLSVEELTSVYKNYKFDHKPATSLPISSYRSKIVSIIETNQVTVIQGATGCGKTTQVPQYILDACCKKDEPCNIVITQPRRIAAITVAKRVSVERNWTLGTLVGYQVGLNNKTSNDTRLTFCTTGVLLQKLINKKHMNDYTHVIIDEVHERDQNVDFALLIVRKLLRTNSRSVKVILMSATFNVKKFSEYFSMRVFGKLEGATIIDLDEVKDKNTYPIMEYYLDQLTELGPLPDIRHEEPGVTELGYKVAVKLIKRFDNLEEQGKKEKKGAVLVFLPGIHEIEELYSHLTMAAKALKIILSTNIAESSITVPDIVYVVDFCLTKHLICDPNTNFTSLQVCWASKTNCIQRAGRSGRVAEGRVYRMVPEFFYTNYLEEEGIPEMLRCPLERLVLQTKLFDMGSPEALLALALDPPDLTNLQNTILLLKELPVDIHIAKMIVLGHMFSVLEECIIMGAAMSLKSLFSTPFQERLLAYVSKLTWADSSCSDCISFLNAYKVWYQNHTNGYFARSAGGGERQWAKSYFIQIRTMREVNILVQELTERLENIGISLPSGSGRVEWNDAEKPLMVIAGAFYPNYFVRGSQGGQIDEGEAVKLLVGRDPYNTVFFQGMPTNQPGELYMKTIKNYLKGCAEEVRVSFDNTRADKAAERAKELGLTGKKGTEEACLLDDQPQKSKPAALLKPNLPGIDASFLQLHISHIVDPGHFWATSADVNSNDMLNWLFKTLNENRGVLKPLDQSPDIGQVYAAPYTECNKINYYRARVDAIHARKNKDHMLQVFFLDYGNTEIIRTSELRDFNDELKEKIMEISPQAFECILSEIQPSLIRNPKGLWTEEAEQAFKQMKDSPFYGKIYSVVNGIVSLELLKVTGRNKQLNVNQWLIAKGYAQRADESYLSKINHDSRITQKDTDNEGRRKYEGYQEDHDTEYRKGTDPEPPSRKDCRGQVTLRGPYSPLEMKFYNLTRVGVSRTVNIEWNSVNSVLLDSEPQDPHDRLLVAASVGQNPEGDRLTLRQITLMPNIHGLASLIPLIFAPFIELRVNKDRTRYTGALCGLGYHQEINEPIFPEHDMEITFDTEITVNDLENINKLRFWMSQCLFTDDYQEIPELGPRDILKCQNSIKSWLFS